AFLNLTAEPAQIVVVYTPGGGHRFYAELGPLTRNGAPDRATVAACFARHDAARPAAGAGLSLRVAALDEAPAARRGVQLAVCDQHLAAADRDDRVADHLDPLVRGVVDVRVQVRVGERHPPLGIEDDQVGVVARQD